MTGPSGQNVSKPFARVHWPSRRCRSRAVTSFAIVYPKITLAASASATFFAMRPMTTATSPSCSTCSL